MKRRTLTLSIGIPVNNEAENILQLLRSIVRQSSETYILKKIYVICDGTTDGTDIIVNTFREKYPFITVLNDHKRFGKLKRLEQLYAVNQSDILCIFDGDVVLGKKDTLDEVVKKFSSTDVVIVSANNQPVPSETITGTLINQWSHVWYLARLMQNDGVNVHNIRGCGMALRKDFARQITFPKELASESQYIYFTAIEKKKKFLFADNAIIYYRKPTTITDYFLQMKRSQPEKEKLDDIFGDWIHPYYRISTVSKYRAVLKAFIQNPILTPLSAIFAFYLQKLEYKQVGTMNKNNGIWKRTVSTKRAIPIRF